MKDTKKIPAAICMVKESIESRKMIFNLAKMILKQNMQAHILV